MPLPEIEDDENCKPVNASKVEIGEVKAGRSHHHGFRLDRVRILNYDDEAAELSQGTMRESLHLATIGDPNALRTLDDEICNQKSPLAILNSFRDGSIIPSQPTELTPRLPE